MSVRVFTNGCFDILHPGHIDLLERAKALGDKLIVGINSDESVRRIKGPGRPFVSESDRKRVLLGLKSVDEVVIFDELTPEELIKSIKPDVLVKGGDWKPAEIIGADFVKASGGKVVSLPLVEGYSTSAIIDRMPLAGNGHRQAVDKINEPVRISLIEHSNVMAEMLEAHTPMIEECGRLIASTFSGGNKVLLCGNGGSAADAQHIAAEFVGRYETERKALPAISLTTDTSALTAVGNDYDFERIFARQVDALAVPGDLLIAISTSGNSPNVIRAVMAARALGARVLGMTGAGGKKLASLCDACFMAPSARTARIQEAHITVAHIWCEMVEREIAAN
jgi:D-sedoheptulose 7-phosphate isomerase